MIRDLKALNPLNSRTKLKSFLRTLYDFSSHNGETRKLVQNPLEKSLRKALNLLNSKRRGNIYSVTPLLLKLKF